MVLWHLFHLVIAGIRKTPEVFLVQCLKLLTYGAVWNGSTDHFPMGFGQRARTKQNQSFLMQLFSHSYIYFMGCHLHVMILFLGVTAMVGCLKGIKICYTYCITNNSSWSLPSISDWYSEKYCEVSTSITSLIYQIQFLTANLYILCVQLTYAHLR